jgi:hypothetical protein
VKGDFDRPLFRQQADLPLHEVQYMRLSNNSSKLVRQRLHPLTVSTIAPSDRSPSRLNTSFHRTACQVLNASFGVDGWWQAVQEHLIKWWCESAWAVSTETRQILHKSTNPMRADRF